MKFAINGKAYEIPKSFTLGEARVLQRESGVGLGGIESAIAAGNSDVIAGLIYIVMHRDNSQVTIADVDALDIATLEFIPDEASDPAGQSPPADVDHTSADPEAVAAQLGSETIRASSGAPE